MSIILSNLLGYDASWVALGITYNLSNITIVLCLGISFWKINKITQDLIGIYRNETTMVWHFVFYMGATLTFNICSILIICSFGNEKDAYRVLKLRLEIAANIFNIMSSLCWRGVTILMLYIFIKYGNPLEEDTEALI